MFCMYPGREDGLCAIFGGPEPFEAREPWSNRSSSSGNGPFRHWVMFCMIWPAFFKVFLRLMEMSGSFRWQLKSLHKKFYSIMSQYVLLNPLTKLPKCPSNSYVHSHENHGVLSQICMGYGVLQDYGFWVRNSREPTRWTENPMGYHRYGYYRFDCMHNTGNELAKLEVDRIERLNNKQSM